MPQNDLPHQTMRVTHVFDFTLLVRARRRQLKLRQIEVARQIGVSRDWLVEFEHGKPTVELHKVFALMQCLGIDVDVTPGLAPHWTRTLTEAAVERRKRLDALRAGRPRIPRPDNLVPPKDWDKLEYWKGARESG